MLTGYHAVAVSLLLANSMHILFVSTAAPIIRNTYPSNASTKVLVIFFFFFTFQRSGDITFLTRLLVTWKIKGIACTVKLPPLPPSGCLLSSQSWGLYSPVTGDTISAPVTEEFSSKKCVFKNALQRSFLALWGTMCKINKTKWKNKPPLQPKPMYHLYKNDHNAKGDSM